jgi:hypothetical protein
MSPLWYWRFIPCTGVKLEFNQFDLFELDGHPIVHLARRDPKQKRKIFKKHIQDDPDRLFKEMQEIDFEISLASINGDGIFNLDCVHVFLFLLMIRTGGGHTSYRLFTFYRREAGVLWRFPTNVGRRTMDQIACRNST